MAKNIGCCKITSLPSPILPKSSARISTKQRRCYQTRASLEVASSTAEIVQSQVSWEIIVGSVGRKTVEIIEALIFFP